jgi:TRAP-type transport system periplasmic protein
LTTDFHNNDNAKREKRMLRSIWTTGLIAGLAIAMLAAGPALAQQKKQIRISHATAGDLVIDNHMSAWVIKNYINDFSDTLDAKVYPAGQLGDERAVVEGMQLGSGAAMMIGGTAIHNNFTKRLGVLDLPFLWRNYDHAHRVLDGKAGEILAAEHEKSGIKILGWTDSWGYRNVVTAKKEIKSAEDLKGLKIRTIQTPTYVAALNAMGANATPMAFGEVYTALQTGVLDGFEHSAPIILGNKLYEVSKHLVLTQHLFGATIMVYSKREWDRLTDKERGVVQAAARLAQDVNRNLSEQRDREALTELKNRGMTITQIDLEPFRKAAVPLQDKIAGEIGASDLLQIIRTTN